MICSIENWKTENATKGNCESQEVDTEEGELLVASRSLIFYLNLVAPLLFDVVSKLYHRSIVFDRFPALQLWSEQGILIYNQTQRSTSETASGDLISLIWENFYL